MEPERPFAVEAGQARAATFERAKQLGFVRLDQDPWTTAMKQAVLVGQGLQEARIEPAADADRAFAPRRIKEVIEHIGNGPGARGDLPDFNVSRGVNVSDIPTESRRAVLDHRL